MRNEKVLSLVRDVLPSASVCLLDVSPKNFVRLLGLSRSLFIFHESLEDCLPMHYTFVTLDPAQQKVGYVQVGYYSVDRCFYVEDFDFNWEHFSHFLKEPVVNNFDLSVFPFGRVVYEGLRYGYLDPLRYESLKWSSSRQAYAGFLVRCESISRQLCW